MLGTTLMLVLLLAEPAADRGVPDRLEPRDVATFSWEEERQTGRLRAGRIEKGWLILENPASEDVVRTVWVLESPPLQMADFALCGDVRAESVPGTGFLEMMVRYPDGNEFLTRAISSSGPMAKLTGSFPARRWLLPFHGQPTSSEQKKPQIPDRIVLQVVLPAGAKGLALGPPTLREYPPGIDILTYEGGGWWTSTFASRLGAAGGVVVGLLGGLLGVLAGMPRTRRVAYLLLRLFLGSGVILLLAALGAIVARQPLFVAYPLILIGAIVTVVGSVLIPVLRKRLAEDAEAAEAQHAMTPSSPSHQVEKPRLPPTS